MIEITDETENGVSICRIRGRLDGATSASADQHLITLAERPETTAIILDLSGLEYISSAGLRVLLMAAKRAQKTSSRLLLASPREAVKQVLDLSGFTSILDIHATRHEALSALSS